MKTSISIQCELGHPILPNGLHLKQEEEEVHTGDYSDISAAQKFLEACGLIPNKDAIEQLAYAFLPALRIMCDRDYPENGALWKGTGWRGLLIDIRKKFGRLWFRGWTKGRFFSDDPIDMINFLGFYLRLANTGEPWGEYGEPGDE
jgi:hypothetical protein